MGIQHNGGHEALERVRFPLLGTCAKVSSARMGGEF